MNRKLEITIRPESSILAKYKEIDYKIESVLSEFIDNSTQSFFDHRDELYSLGNNKVTIEIDIFKDYITVKDNAFGMSEKDFKRALKLDSPPEDTSGRNEKGMGLKTAATYLGSYWSVNTTEYGSKALYQAEMDIDYIQKKAPEKIIANVYNALEEQHYTVIEIKNLNQKITPAKISKLTSTIAEMYSRDIKNGDATIVINKVPLHYSVPELRVDDNGEEYIKQIDNTISYEGKLYTYSGWVGIRKKGATASSGLTLLHKGRAVLTNYRPKDLLGNPNSFPYQRVIGEIDMGDEWPISHTKDAFLWDGGLEDIFIEKLKEKKENGIGDLISLSSKLRSDDIKLEDKKKVTKKTQSTFRALKDVSITARTLNEEVKLNDYVPENLSKPRDKTICIEFQDKKYEFEIIEELSKEKEWIKIEKTINDDYYYIRVDYDMPFFHDIFKDRNNKNNHSYEFMEKLVVAIALSYITSKSNGCKDGHILINMLNALIANTD